MQGVDFTPLNTVGAHIVVIIQMIGGLLLLVGFGFLGLMMLTSFGNEHRKTLVKTAAIDLILGFILVLGAPEAAHIIQGAFSFLTSSTNP